MLADGIDDVPTERRLRAAMIVRAAHRKVCYNSLAWLGIEGGDRLFSLAHRQTRIEGG